MAPIDFPEDLLALERAAWDEIQAGALTVDTAAAVHAAVTAFAAEAGHDRHEVEMGLKRAVRHPVPAEGDSSAPRPALYGRGATSSSRPDLVVAC